MSRFIKGTIVLDPNVTGGESMIFYYENYTTNKRLHMALKADDLWQYCPPGTLAFTNCYRKKKGKLDIGKMYFIEGGDNNIIAHESTHMALHILSLLGYANMPIVDAGERAPEIEESLCYLVGHITEKLMEQLQ